MAYIIQIIDLVGKKSLIYINFLLAAEVKLKMYTEV